MENVFVAYFERVGREFCSGTYHIERYSKKVSESNVYYCVLVEVDGVTHEEHIEVDEIFEALCTMMSGDQPAS